jgi:hypothetical protein
MNHSPVVERPHPRGMTGVRTSAEETVARIARGYRNPYLIAWVRQTIQAAKLPDARGYPQPDNILRALFDAQKKKVAFVKDPVDTEAIGGAAELLCLDPAGFCYLGGDCDDQLVVLGSAAMAAGIPVKLRVRRYAGQSQAHVTLLYDSAPRTGGPWKCIDPSVDSGVCSSAPYEEEFIMEIPTGTAEHGTFIGTGAPPVDVLALIEKIHCERCRNFSWLLNGSMLPVLADGAWHHPSCPVIRPRRSLEGSTLGDAPAQLPADQAAAWLGVLQGTRDYLARSASRLRANSAANAQVRADLGIVAFDAPPGEGGGGAPPLAAYAQTGAWTKEAADAESKLLATADFLVGAMDDGLAGRRPLYWHDGDLYVGAQPGDPYRVLMAPGPDGSPVPTYFDPVSNQPSGQIGFVVAIVVAAVVAVVAVAAAYATAKICDYLATKHHDEMLADVAHNQDQMIQTGQMTPDQALAQTKALTDLSKASAKPPSPSIWSRLPFLGPGLALVLGVGGGFLLARFGGAATRLLPAHG